MNVSSSLDRSPEDLPEWLSLSIYEAETTDLEKTNRVVNNCIFAAGLYGAYALATGGTGILVHASYLSLGLAIRKVTSTALGYFVYPAAFTSCLCCMRESILEEENSKIQQLEAENFIVKKILLYKSGTKYDAALITHPDSLQNNYWTINALDNGSIMECCILRIAKENFSNNCNTLLINGPSVSQSGGWPTRYQLSAGLEAGIKFLEREVKATHIIMRGVSIGGATMGEAISNHDFTEGMKKNIRYLSITDCSFSRLSTMAGAFAGRAVKPLFYATGTELDGIAAARKLSQLGIQHIIINHSSASGNESDSVIPDNASLAYELHKEQPVENRLFLESPSIIHNKPLPLDIKASLNCEIQKFITS